MSKIIKRGDEARKALEAALDELRHSNQTSCNRASCFIN